MSVCLVFSTGEKIVLIKYSDYCNIGNNIYEWQALHEFFSMINLLSQISVSNFFY